MDDEEAARQLLAQVKNDPDSFAELARTKSKDARSAPNGGDLGTINLGQIPPAFSRAVSKLKPGDVSDVFKTKQGYHIVRITEREQGEVRPFDEVKEQIRKRLHTERAQEQLRARLEALERKADLRIDDDVIARLAPRPAPGGSEHPPAP